MRLFINILCIFLSVHAAADSTSCYGEGDSTKDWLVVGCDSPSVFSSDSTKYTLSNGIITRQWTHNVTSNSLTTTSITFDANATSENILLVPAPESNFVANNISIQVGGNAHQIKDSVLAQFSTVRSDLSPVAGGFAFIPGIRRSNPNANWPPKGNRVEFDHVVSCDAINAGSADEILTVTIVYEQYVDTSGFSRRVAFMHNCSTSTVDLSEINVASVATQQDQVGIVEYNCDTFSGQVFRATLSDGTVTTNMGIQYGSNHNKVGLQAGEHYESFLATEVIHSYPYNLLK